MSSTTQTPQKKVALRTCIACGKNGGKQEFVRFARSKEGVVSCDTSGKAAGRGAYICASEECFDAATKRGRLASSLRSKLTSEDYQRLEALFKEACATLAQSSQKGF